MHLYIYIYIYTCYIPVFGYIAWYSRIYVGPSLQPKTISTYLEQIDGEPTFEQNQKEKKNVWLVRTSKNILIKLYSLAFT